MIYAIFFVTVLAVTTSSSGVFNTTSNGFPKVIWTYWEQGLELAPIFTKLCTKNTHKTAEENGWTHVILSFENLGEYIDVGLVQKYFAMSLTRHVQLRADLVRIFLILKYGGLWIDINSYFLRDLSWVENPDHPLISNRLTDAPDIILAASTEGLSDGPATLRRSKKGEMVNIFPVLENWMILAKPNSEFLQDCLKVYVEAHQRSIEIYKVQTEKKRIVVPKALLNYYFVACDFSEQVALQLKQKQLQQQNSSLFAIEHYKLWQVESHLSAFKIFLDYDQYMLTVWADESTYSTEQLGQGTEAPFFRKFIGWQHRFFSNFLANYAAYNCWGLDFLVEQGSEVREALFADARGAPFMHSIEETDRSLLSRDYCRGVEEGRRVFGFYGALWLCFWGLLLAVFLLANLCSWAANREEGEEEWQLLSGKERRGRAAGDVEK